MINRTLFPEIHNGFSRKKVLVILGPRQSGKTTFSRLLAQQVDGEPLWWDGDEADIRSMLENPTSTRLKKLIGNHKLLVIDEAQRIENIGICLKLISDQIPDVRVIATGSSSFDLANKVNEPLTGRKIEFNLLPFSFEEMVNHHGLLEEKRLIEHRLIFGYYPEVVTSPGHEKELLSELSDSYLYKDILTWQNIQKPDKLEKLIQALALQIGNEVSYNELGQTCGLDNQTVESYVQLLEKAFIVYRLPSLSRNLRNELKKSRKIYFYDLGIRNAVIKNFSTLGLRNDVGALWENFCVNERLKLSLYHRKPMNRFFWRTFAQQEIDLIEEYDGLLHAFEFKWNSKRKVSLIKTFANAYPEHTFDVITKENCEDYFLFEE